MIGPIVIPTALYRLNDNNEGAFEVFENPPEDITGAIEHREYVKLQSWFLAIVRELAKKPVPPKEEKGKKAPAPPQVENEDDGPGGAMLEDAAEEAAMPQAPAAEVVLCLRGVDSSLPAALAALGGQRYQGPWRLLVVVDSLEDPSWPLAEQVLSQLEASGQASWLGVRLIPLAARPEAGSLKSASLRQAFGVLHPSTELVALVDADAVVAPGGWRRWRRAAARLGWGLSRATDGMNQPRVIVQAVAPAWCGRFGMGVPWF